MDELQKLYDVLKREGYYTKSFDDFNTQFEDTEYQDKVFGVVSRDGLYTKDKQSFIDKYSKKKEVGEEDSMSSEEYTAFNEKAEQDLFKGFDENPESLSTASNVDLEKYKKYKEEKGEEIKQPTEQPQEDFISEDENKRVDAFIKNPRLLQGASDRERELYLNKIKSETPEPVIKAKQRRIDAQEAVKKETKSLTEENVFGYASQKVDNWYSEMGGLTPIQKMNQFSERVDSLRNKYEQDIKYVDVANIEEVQGKYKSEVLEIANELGLETTEDGAVKPFDNEIDQYKEKIDTELSIAENSLTENERKGWGEDALFRVSGALEGFYGSMIDMAGVATGLNYFDAYKNLSEGARYRGEQLREQANRYDGTIQGYAEEGNYGKAAALAASSTLESLPNMIPMFVNPEYGLYVMAGGAGIDKYREIESKDIPKWKKISTATIAGISEAVFEKAFTLPILMRSKEAFKTLGKAQAKKVISDTVEKGLKTSAYKSGGQMPAWVGEGLSEVATGLTNDITDKIYIDPETQIGSHAFDDFVVGAVMGKVFDAPRSLVSHIEKSEQKKLVQEAVKNVPSDLEYYTQLDLISILSERAALQKIEDGLAPEFKGQNKRRIDELTKEASDIMKPYYQEKYDYERGVEDDQTKLDYLRSRGVRVEDGTDMDTLNEMYQTEKANEDKENIQRATGEEAEEVATPPTGEKPAITPEKEGEVKEAVSQKEEKLATEEGDIIDAVINSSTEELKADDVIVGSKTLNDIIRSKTSNPNVAGEYFRNIIGDIRSAVQALNTKFVDTMDIIDTEEGGVENIEEVLFSSRIQNEKDANEKRKKVDDIFNNLRDVYEEEGLFEDRDFRAIFNEVYDNRHNLAHVTVDNIKEQIGIKPRVNLKEKQDGSNEKELQEVSVQEGQGISEQANQEVKDSEKGDEASKEDAEAITEAPQKPTEAKTEQKGTITPTETKVAEKRFKTAKDFIDAVISDPINLRDVEIEGLTNQQVEQGVKNLKEGKTTKASQALTDALTKMYDGNVTFKGNIMRGGARTNVPYSEFEKSVKISEEAQRKAESEMIDADIEAQAKAIEQTTGIKPKNLRDVYKAGREVFGLNRSQALAQAIITDRIIGKISKSTGKSKARVYGSLEYRKTTPEQLSKDAQNLYQAVWHGSPHAFEKFTTDKIGTGEGAQAFGWGLYFTDRKGIAEGYAKALGAAALKIDGKSFYDIPEIEPLLADYDFLMDISIPRKAVDYAKLQKDNIKTEMGKMDSRLKNIKEESNKYADIAKKRLEKKKVELSDAKEILDRVENAPLDEDSKSAVRERYAMIIQGLEAEVEQITSETDATNQERWIRAELVSGLVYQQSLLDAANYIIDNADKITSEGNRNLYKVKLHGDRAIDDFNYLRWDKPLTKKQADLLNENYNEAFDELLRYRQSLVDKYGGQRSMVKQKTEKEAKRLRELQQRSEEIGRQTLTGRELYDELVQLLGSQKEASLYLLNLGIDGIKYPTEITSKGTHEESFNYVIFDENVAEIEEHIKFQKDRTVPQGAKGAMQTLANGNSIIHALTDPNVSTPLHEIAHVYEKYMTKSERDAVLKWAGDKTWTVDTSEKFARGFEKYLAEGVAPNKALEGAFKRFKEWLTDIYNGITGSEIDIELNDAMRGVYSAMLGEGVVKPSKGKKATKKEISDNDISDMAANIAFQTDAKFQGAITPEQWMNTVIDAAEQRGENPRDFLEAKIKELKLPINQESIDNVLDQRGYAKETQKLRKESKGAEQKGEPVGGVREGDGAKATQEKERQFGKKVTESTILGDDIKSEIKKEGIGYIPRGRKVTKKEAQELIRLYESQGGMDKVKSQIIDMMNDIPNDTRILMAATYTNRMLALGKSAKTKDQAEKYNKNARDVFRHYINRSTGVAQELEAMKNWKEVIGTNPEFVGEVVKDQAKAKNKEFFDKNKDDIKTAQQIITDYLNSDEFKNRYSKKAKPSEPKKTREQRIQEGKAQVANALDKLASLRGIKKNAVSENEIGEKEYEIVLDVAKGLVKIGVASAEDLIDKLKVQLRKYFKPSDIDKMASRIKKDTDIANNTTKKPPKVTLSENEETKLVDALYAKMVIATKKQLKQLIADNIELFVREGAIEDESFREIFAKALGQEYVSDAQIEALKSHAETINDAEEVAKNILKMFESETKETDPQKIRKLRKNVEEQLRLYKKALIKAGVANQEIGKVFAEPTTTAKLLATNIQGNLLTPASLVVNIVSNTTWLPVRAVKNLIATATDLGVMEVGAITKNMRKNVNFLRNPKIKKVLDAMLDSEQQFIDSGFNKGYLRGAKAGTVEGLLQMWYGQLSDDLYRRDLNKAIHPYEAWINLYNMARGKEKAKMTDAINNFIEATISVPPEIMFRLLNLGDKPYRRGAEQAELEAIAKNRKKQWEKDYLASEASRLGMTEEQTKEFVKKPDADSKKLMEEEWELWKTKFFNFPDEESAERARQAGLEATYQQDNIISDFINKLDRTKAKGAKESLDTADMIVSSLLRFFKVSQMPYVKTPTNILLETFDYVAPWWSASKALYYTVKGEKRKAIDSFARSITGTVLNGAINVLFSTGILSFAAGGADDDEPSQSVRAAEYRNKPAYYINTTAMNRLFKNVVYGENNSLTPQAGDAMHSYQRLGLISSMLMTHGKAYKGLSLEEIREMTAMDRNLLSFLPAIQSGLDQSFVTGIASLINAVQGASYERDTWLFNTSRAMSASVLPNTVRSYGQARDNYIRETRDRSYENWDKLPQRFKRDLQAALKTESGLPTKVTVWGERVNRFEDGKHPLFRMFDITRSREYKSDFGVKLFELYERTKDNSVLLTPISHNIRYMDKTIKLPPKMLESLQIYVGSEYKRIIEPIINSMEYSMLLSDDDKLDFVKELFQGKDGDSRIPTRTDLKKEWIDNHYYEIEKLFTEQHGNKAREEYYRRKSE